MLNNVDKIYICHYTKLVKRKKVVMEQLSKCNLDAEWVLNYDKEDIDLDKLINKFININKPLGLGGIHTDRTLRLSEVSLLMKHNYIWEQIVDNNIECCLILEDDVLLCDDFVNKFNNQIINLSETFDLVWIGSCCDLHENSTSDRYLYKTTKGSRCTHAYLISNKCAKKMLEFIKTNNYPADFMFNSAIETYRFENYWMEPDLISQNSKWESTIQNDTNFI